MIPLKSLQNDGLFVQNLACARGGRLLFSALSFDLKPGESLHIQGPNGVGKTSLLRMIAGLLKPVDGDLIGDSLNSVAFLPSTPNMKNHLTVQENIKLLTSLNICCSNSINLALEVLEIQYLLDLPLHCLSKGQLQRVHLLRLFLKNNQLWLLDEPFLALDHQFKKSFQFLTDDFCQKGGMVIMASHDRYNTSKTLSMSNYLIKTTSNGDQWL